MTVRSKNLRNSAKDAPHCFGCFIQNPNGDRLCLAHSSLLADGRGVGHKSDDDKGAILCDLCHRYVDGNRDTKEARVFFHSRAHELTMQWWQSNGYV
jgi:hypothetical protein